MLKLMVTRNAVCILAVVFAGCGGGPVDENTVLKSALESQTVSLDAEQVSLNQRQVNCGVQAELWEPPVQAAQRSTARLTEAGKALKFYDDVSIGEEGYSSPYVQVRGQFGLAVEDIISVRPGPNAKTKIVQVKAGITVSHNCLGNPLPIMGIRKGRFSQDAAPQFQLHQEDDGWKVDQIVH